jgi:FtsZ-binding cell division protein ZapB
MGNKRKKLQAKIDATATDLKNLKAEIETLKKQRSELEGEVTVTEKLRLEANRLQKSGQSVKSLLTANCCSTKH